MTKSDLHKRLTAALLFDLSRLPDELAGISYDIEQSLDAIKSESLNEAWSDRQQRLDDAADSLRDVWTELQDLLTETE